MPSEIESALLTDREREILGDVPCPEIYEIVIGSDERPLMCDLTQGHSDLHETSLAAVPVNDNGKTVFVDMDIRWQLTQKFVQLGDDLAAAVRQEGPYWNRPND